MQIVLHGEVRRTAKSDTQSLCTLANGEGDGRGNVKQEHVFNGNQRAKCETRERWGGKMGRWTQKAPQKPSGNRHAWCARAALRERLPATAHAVKPLSARSGRCAGQTRYTARGAMEVSGRSSARSRPRIRRGRHCVELDGRAN